MRCLFEELRQSLAFLGVKQAGELPSSDPLLRDAKHLRRATIAVEDCAVRIEGDSAFLHLLDQKPIRPVSRFQRVDTVVAAAFADDDGVNLAVSDGLQKLAGLG